MKAIIEVGGKGTVFKAAREQLVQKVRGRAPDYRLSFESARTLFAELTPARLDLLNTLRGNGPGERVCVGQDGRAQLLECPCRCCPPRRTGADRTHR